MDDLRRLTDKFNRIKEEIKEEMKEEGSDAMKEGFKGIFDKYPWLSGIKWSQYTPYFNDGDSCTFGVNEAYIKIDGEVAENDYGDEDEWLEDGFYWDYKSNAADQYKHVFNKKWTKYLPDIKAWEAFFKEIEDVKSAVPEELLKDFFEDHVEVIVTRDGITTEEYEHD